jgi:hypothetical protein
MHDPNTTKYTGQHIPFKQEGWGIALAVCVLAVASAAGAFYVHKKTYIPPTDVRSHAIGAHATPSH